MIKQTLIFKSLITVETFKKLTLGNFSDQIDIIFNALILTVAQQKDI